MRVTDELPVEVLVELPDVPRVDVEVGRSKGLDLKELDVTSQHLGFTSLNVFGRLSLTLLVMEGIQETIAL